MSFGENVRHVRLLLGWKRGDLVDRLGPKAKGRDRAKLGQQVYQLERRASRHSELLLPLADAFGIAPDLLLNRDLTSLTLAEMRLLREDAAAPVPNDLLVPAERFVLATDGTRTMIEKIVAADRDNPAGVRRLSIIVDVYLDDVRARRR
jgi:transcriptional regulator with XRE-family HTH domain